MEVHRQKHVLKVSSKQTIFVYKQTNKVHRKPDFHLTFSQFFTLFASEMNNIHNFISFTVKTFETKIASGTIIKNVNCNVFSCKSLCKIAGFAGF